jgi:hypothetical protein
MMTEVIAPPQPVTDHNNKEHQEADIIRLLINYGNHDLFFEEQVNERQTEIVTEKVMSFLVHEVEQDQIKFDNATYSKIFSVFSVLVHQEGSYDPNILVHHPDADVRQTAADMLTVKYPLANWQEKGVEVKAETDRLKHAAQSAVCSLKIKQVNKLIAENRDKIKAAAEKNEDIIPLLEHQKVLDGVKSKLSEYLSIVVLK